MPYRDTQCGAKLFKRKAIESVISNLSMSQWAFDVELLYHLRKKGFVIKEIPTRWSDKEYSKIHFAKAGPFMALSIVRLRLLNSPFKSFVKVYNKMFDYYKNQKPEDYFLQNGFLLPEYVAPLQTCLMKMSTRHSLVLSTAI